MGDIEGLPRMNRLAKELTNWLILGTILILVIYGILLIIYEVTLDLTHVRWVFIGFLICCALDIVVYWVCGYAVQDENGDSKLLHVILALQIFTCLYFLIACVVVLCTFKIEPVISMKKGATIKDGKKADYEDQFYHTFDDYVAPYPCEENDKSSEYAWQCNYERSLRTAAWCMLILLFPKLILCYAVFRILKKVSRRG